MAVIVASVAWYWIHRAMLRRRRPRIAVEQLERGGGAYLRGLLPFERGEKLLGRARDASMLLTKLRNRECRFAYVSGDAGVGKTSLLRSAVMAECRRNFSRLARRNRLVGRAEARDPVGAHAREPSRRLGRRFHRDGQDLRLETGNDTTCRCAPGPSRQPRK